MTETFLSVFTNGLVLLSLRFISAHCVRGQVAHFFVASSWYVSLSLSLHKN